ncbi:MAG: hypothetical protein WAN44_20215 [Propionibacteriaceae bacterium]
MPPRWLGSSSSSSRWGYVDNRDLAAHGVRIQGQVVWADADGSDEVVYTVDGTDYQDDLPNAVFGAHDHSHPQTDGGEGLLSANLGLRPLHSHDVDKLRSYALRTRLPDGWVHEERV